MQMKRFHSHTLQPSFQLLFNEFFFAYSIKGRCIHKNDFTVSVVLWIGTFHVLYLQRMGPETVSNGEDLFSRCGIYELHIWISALTSSESLFDLQCSCRHQFVQPRWVFVRRCFRMSFQLHCSTHAIIVISSCWILSIVGRRLEIAEPMWWVMLEIPSCLLYH